MLGLGVWVLVDPMGFKEIVAANPLLFAGVYVILAIGAMLFLLGFLGCCGALRENQCLLLFVSATFSFMHSSHKMECGIVLGHFKGDCCTNCH